MISSSISSSSCSARIRVSCERISSRSRRMSSRDLPPSSRCRSSRDFGVPPLSASSPIARSLSSPASILCFRFRTTSALAPSSSPTCRLVLEPEAYSTTALRRVLASTGARLIRPLARLQLVDPARQQRLARIAQRADRARRAPPVPQVMIDRRAFLPGRVAFPAPVTKRAAVVAAGLDPCPMPAHQHLPGRIPQLVGHRRRAAIVLLVHPHHTKPLLPRVLHHQWTPFPPKSPRNRHHLSLLNIQSRVSTL